MKQSIIISLFCIVLLPMELHSQIIMEWADPVPVFDETTYDCERPRVALLRNEAPAIVWGDNVADKIYFSKWDADAWTTPIQLNTEGDAYTFNWTGPEIVTFGDTIFVAFKEYPENTGPVKLARSFDAGNTWVPEITVTDEPESILMMPSIALDPEGHPIILFISSHLDYSEPHYVATRSYDFGSTFTAPVNSSGYSGGESCDCCSASIVSNTDYTIGVYRDNLDNIRNMWAAISTDDGASFEEGVQIDATDWNYFTCPSTGPDAIIFGDTLYATWMSAPLGPSRVYTTKLSLSTMSDSPDELVTETYEGLNAQNFPRLANNGQVAAMIWKQNGLDSHSQIMARFTEDITAGWGALDTISDQDNGGVDNGDVAVSSTDVHVVWQDWVNKRIFYSKGNYAKVAAIQDDQTPSIQIWPQPASAFIQIQGIQLNTIQKVTIQSISGQYYPADIVQDAIAIDALSAGLYLLVITSTEGQSAVPFIKQ